MDCFLSIPDGINNRLIKYQKKKGYTTRQPIVINALEEYLTKNGF